MTPTPKAPETPESPMAKFITPKWVLFYAAVLIVVGGVYPFIALGPCDADIAKMGLFGDMFGVVGELVSVLGFMGIMWSLYVQNEQLKTSRVEMEHNAKASERLADAIRVQSAALSQQNELMSKQIEITKGQSFINIQNARIRTAEVMLIVRRHARELQDRPPNVVINGLIAKISDIDAELGAVYAEYKNNR